MPHRRDGIPIRIDTVGRIERLQRVALNDREISEGWLQQKLFEYPDLLPVGEIDPGFGPLIPVGREIPTAVGSIDNLYVSPDGLLTLVEAKLWRNPEARRAVIGQILDYAQDMSRWSYERLDGVVKNKSNRSLCQLVSQELSGEVDEAQFVDAVSRNLRAGRFLLLIAGDGIREEMELLASFLQDPSHLRFTLALLELQLYRTTDGALYVWPLVVSRTVEIERGVIHVSTTGDAHVQVTLDIDRPPPPPGGLIRSTLSRDDFFHDLAKGNPSPQTIDVANRLLSEFENDDDLFVEWKAGSFVIKMRDPDRPSYFFTFLVVQRSGTAYVGWLPMQLEKVDLPDRLGLDFVRDTAKLVGTTVSSRSADNWERPIPLQHFAKNLQAFCNRMRELAEAIRHEREVAGE